jgi:hypothetical protein
VPVAAAAVATARDFVCGPHMHDDRHVSPCSDDEYDEKKQSYDGRKEELYKRMTD